MGCLFHGFSVGQTCLRGVLLPDRVQQSVVSLLYLINYAPVGVIECKIRGEQSRTCGIDSSRPGAEVEHGVIQIECQLKALDGLAMESVSKERLDTFGLRNCRSRQRRVQLTSSNPQSRRLRASTLPGGASRGIVGLRQVNQLRQGIRLGLIYSEPR